MVTLHDIAESVGVARSTVSRVLNRKPGIAVSDAVCAKIFAAADRLGYRRNYHAHALHAGRANAIGFAMAYVPGAPYFDQLLQGSSDAVSRHGQSLVIIAEQPSIGTLIGRCLSGLDERRFDALVIPGIFPLAPHAKALRQAPVVVVEYVFSDLPPHLHSVRLDPVPGIAAAVDHLAALGHRHLAWFGPPAAMAASSEIRRAAFLAAARRHRIAIEDVACESTRNSGGFLDMGTLMSDARSRFASHLAGGGAATGVVCHNEIIAHGVYHAAADRGMRVPDDLSVIGFDDFHAAFAMPPMTVVSHMLVRLGAVAGETAMALAASAYAEREKIPRRQIIAAELVVRGSTTVPR